MFVKKTMDLHRKTKTGTLPETNIAPKDGCLEYYFPFWIAYFQGRTVSFKEGNNITRPHTKSQNLGVRENASTFPERNEGFVCTLYICTCSKLSNSESSLMASLKNKQQQNTIFRTSNSTFQAFMHDLVYLLACILVLWRVHSLDAIRLAVPPYQGRRNRSNPRTFAKPNVQACHECDELHLGQIQKNPKKCTTIFYLLGSMDGIFTIHECLNFIVHVGKCIIQYILWAIN